MSEAGTLADTLTRLEGIAENLSRLDRAPREYLGVEEAASFLNLSRIQLDEWRSRNTGGPAWHKVGRRVIYAVADLRAFMDANRKAPLA
jgi:hypothetical protein